MKEIGKNDQKLLIQLPRENNWHLLSDDAHKISHVFTPCTKNQELKVFSYSSINGLVVHNPFQKDYDHIGRIPHYKYWSPEQEPDPTENFVGALTQILSKTVYYHNLYYEPDTVFIGDKSPSTTINNQENPNLKIIFNHQKAQENRGTLKKIMNLKNT